jgi:transcriptional regulator with GAF, ATPase, and Fis domain
MPLDSATPSFDPFPVPEDTVSNWQTLVDTMAEAMDVPAGLIMRLSGEEIEVSVSSRTEDNPYEPGDKEEFFDSGLYCETVIRSGETLKVPDALADPDWRENPDVELGMISYLGMPIRLPDGSPFGTICVLDRKGNPYSDTYIRLLKQFRNMAEGHLAMAQLNERLNRKNKELEGALEEVRTLQEILPVCMGCKKVRDDRGYWSRLEAYLEAHPKILLSHSFCPECADKWKEDLNREWEESREADGGG